MSLATSQGKSQKGTNTVVFTLPFGPNSDVFFMSLLVLISGDWCLVCWLGWVGLGRAWLGWVGLP